MIPRLLHDSAHEAGKDMRASRVGAWTAHKLAESPQSVARAGSLWLLQLLLLSCHGSQIFEIKLLLQCDVIRHHCSE